LNGNPCLARDIIDARHNVHHACGIGLKDGAYLAMAGARLRRGERDVLRPGWLRREHDRQPIHGLTLRITDAPAPLHAGRGRATPALPLTQWPEGRAQLGREELRLLTSKHWIERGEVERLIP
jgi:hypothetical protein